MSFLPPPPPKLTLLYGCLVCEPLIDFEEDTEDLTPGFLASCLAAIVEGGAVLFEDCAEMMADVRNSGIDLDD